MVENNNPQSPTQFGWGISHRLFHDDAGYPVYIDDATITEWNGKHIPASFKADANHTVESAVDGARVSGYLVMVEDRTIEAVKVGTLQIHGGTLLPIKDADTLAPGDLVVGAGAGEIRKADLTVLAEVAAGAGRLCTAVLTADDGVLICIMKMFYPTPMLQKQKKNQ